jgi:hypothetical protein
MRPDPRKEPFKEFDYHVTYGHQESHKCGVALSWFLQFSMTAGDLALCDPLPMLCAVINPRNSHIPARANSRAVSRLCR